MTRLNAFNCRFQVETTRELGSFMPKRRMFFNYGSNLRRSRRFDPSSMAGSGRLVSRAEMNAKYAPLIPAFPNRRSPMLLLRLKARRRALTKPTLSCAGYSRVLPAGRTERPEGRWLGFVVSHPCRKVRGKDGVPVRGSGEISLPKPEHFAPMPQDGMIPHTSDHYHG